MEKIIRQFFMAAVIGCFLSFFYSPSILATGSDLSGEEEVIEEADDWGEDTDEENHTGKQPSLEARFQATEEASVVNKSSRLNPDGQFLDIEPSKMTIELDLGLSDYLDDGGSFRWMFKGYGSAIYEKGAEEDQNSDQLRINELFLDWSLGDWFISAGKRRNSWGPALAFNPVNVVVPARDPLDPDDQREGQPMLWLNYANDIITLDLIMTRNYDRNWSGKYLRWGSRLSVLMGEWETGFFYFDGEEDKDNTEYNTMTGLSLSGNFLDDATLYLEAARFWQNPRNYYLESGLTENREEAVVKIAAGLMITVDGNTSFMIEIYHNSGGYTSIERENYFKAVDSALEPFPDPTKLGVFNDFQFSEMNRNYLLVSFRKSEIWEKYSYNLQYIMAEDGSATSEILGAVNLSDYYKLSSTIKLYIGDENSEFGNNLVSSQLELVFSASF